MYKFNYINKKNKNIIIEFNEKNFILYYMDYMERPFIKGKYQQKGDEIKFFVEDLASFSSLNQFGMEEILYNRYFDIFSLSLPHKFIYKKDKNISIDNDEWIAI
ncbi:MAG: hypothetical protein LBM93_13085 [Oscillospiraceae bacterium]|nr:hypothetical protein [Oscillospiraceae bacterium]